MSIQSTQFHKNKCLNEKEKKKILSCWMDAYQNLVFSVCCKITGDYFTAEDLTQETFLAAYRNMDGFDMENEKAWLCRIASNKCIDYMRSSKKRAVITEESFFLNQVDSKRTPEAHCLDLEAKEQLLEYCNRLHPPYKEIAIAVYCDDKRPEEIAVRQNKNLKTVQTQIYRARDMLRKIYAKEAGYEGKR